MRRTLRRTGLFSIGAIAAMAMALPTAAGADTTTLSNTDGINFANTDPAFHPGDPYPSTITGPAGTVNDVNVSISQSLANPEEFDFALVSPNGTAVHIQSDACATEENVFHSLSFDDEGAAAFLGVGACPSANNPYLVTNLAPINDIYSAPGPQMGTLNALSFFDGGPSGGTWSLFTMDDTGDPPMTGGSISGWSITFDFTPPAPVTPNNPVTTPTPPGPTGQQAAALAKCKKKRGKARKKCKRKARLLPL